MSILSGRDNAVNGIANQRVDQVSNDIYGAKTLNNFLNPAAFARPAAGGFSTSAQQHHGTEFPQSGSGAITSRILSGDTDHRAAAGGVQPVQYLHRGMPNNNFGSGTFGRIVPMTGDPPSCSSASSTASEE
jgi:hypothetical protein